MSYDTDDKYAIAAVLDCLEYGKSFLKNICEIPQMDDLYYQHLYVKPHKEEQGSCLD